MKKALLGLPLLLLVVCCAKENEFDPADFHAGSFARWMEKYYPNIPKLKDDTDGIYAEWIERNPDGTRLRDGYWLQMDYTICDQNGDVFYTRSQEEARRTFGPYFDRTIHYVPEQIEYSSSSMVYTHAAGQLQALEQMHEGDSVHLYLSPAWGYTSGGFTYSAANYYGYALPTASVSTRAGLIVEMRLNRVIKDINLYEREQVARWAADSLGITDAADSVALGVYMKKLVENPEGDSVKSNSTAQVYYTTRFLDGHVLDTNIDSVATAHGITVSEAPTEMTPWSDLIAAYSAVLLKMQAGERARFVTVSDQAYGSDGETDTSDGHVIIPPYTPLEFEFYIESVETGEEDEEEEE